MSDNNTSERENKHWETDAHSIVAWGDDDCISLIDDYTDTSVVIDESNVDEVLEAIEQVFGDE